eukprot:CAMPEP_0183360750 /NCGR_PEP_ID=MMETSP0164_2-20130417/56052_1 /TAXON_ID=221442 /ORGANISM="Coccolithus pelagicus ssp braarudi, Strain PLY182g" /LENGTH=156 /DNA_ID=CAMNT_0025535175 /DNA_START=131 /DNA_END=601 /DNA_ORIENTATION=-
MAGWPFRELFNRVLKGRVASVAQAEVAVDAASAQVAVENFPYPHSNTYDMRLQQCNGQMTIHGLWPQWADSCGGPAFDESQISSILSQMQTDWPSCVGSSSNEQFWSHEWEKHGSCTGLSQLDYFSTALKLYTEYNNGQTDICFDKSFNLINCPSS